MKVKFKTGVFTFYVELNDTLTAREIAQNLPIKSTVSRWGDEIYFDIGFKASSLGAVMDVNVGDVAYWSQGKCLCIFFGPTLASTNAKPVPASPVVIVGKTNASPQGLRQVQLGENITVSLCDEDAR
jgi:hypothetical protein